MDGSAPAYRPDRHPSESYDDILNRDTRVVPDFLRQGPTPDLGLDAVPVSRYFDPAFFQKEVDHVWSKIWQMACREEDIPNAGDYHIYEIVGKSFIVTRTAAGDIRAYYNACLHRGRKLLASQMQEPLLAVPTGTPSSDAASRYVRSPRSTSFHATPKGSSSALPCRAV